MDNSLDRITAIKFEFEYLIDIKKIINILKN